MQTLLIENTWAWNISLLLQESVYMTLNHFYDCFWILKIYGMVPQNIGNIINIAIRWDHRTLGTSSKQ